jgi:hypothetical protein
MKRRKKRMSMIKKEPAPPGGSGGAEPPGSPDDDDGAEVVNSWHWIMVLAAPTLYRTIQRAVDPVYLVSLIDILIAYAERGSRYLGAQFSPVPYERRAPLARELRALLIRWSPPELPVAITMAARELLHAEGMAPPEGNWDALKNEGPEPVEDILIWPEAVWTLRGRRARAS